MRVAWVTPCDARSAIAEFSRHVVGALAALADVEIWTADAGAVALPPAPVVSFDAAAADVPRLRAYDHVVYNLSNYYPFGGQVYTLSQLRPGAVILHDRVMHHVLAEIWRRQPGGLDGRYIDVMRVHHGDNGRRIARAVVGGARPGPWESPEEAARYPLDVAALRGALAAVTHSPGHAASLRRRWLGPVCALPHPCYGPAAGAPAAAARAPSRVQLTSVGHVARNKHIDRVLALLAADPGLSGRVHYTIAGSLDGDPSYALELRRTLAAAPHVSADLVGWASERELDRLMEATEVFINLRHPVTESGSGSLARELAYGRPVLCFDEGCFGEVDADAVARVPTGDFDLLAAELRRLLDDPVRRRHLGERARLVASERSARAYARALLEFLEAARVSAPALTLLDRVAAELGAMAADPDVPVFERIASDLGPALCL